MQVISLSPSFSSYSDSKLSQIAARVVDEFDSDESSDEFYFESRENSAAHQGGGGGGVSDEDDYEFEFAIVARDLELPSHTSADEIFQNGKIRPVYPVFNRDLLLGHVEFHNENEKENDVQKSVSPKIRLPLRKLFLEERETTITTSSSSSSESDDLDGVTAENYCVWPPKPEVEDHRCKKSSSTGCNSKRWKLKDFLHRSNSDGSENSFVVLSHSNSGREKEMEKKVTETAAYGGKVKLAVPPSPPLPCKRNGGQKQRSYLPYKQDLVGLFGNVNGLRKNLQSF